jgi:hypothetical protein
MSETSTSETPADVFPTIESAHDYLRLLGEALDEARAELAAEVQAALRSGDSRRLQACQLTAHCAEQLHQHLSASRRRLNDLRSLRRLLLGQRVSAAKGEDL